MLFNLTLHFQKCSMNVSTIINTQNNRNESSRVVKEKFFDFSREKKKNRFISILCVHRLKRSRFLNDIILFKPFNFPPPPLWTFLRSLISSYRKRDITCPICLAKSLSSLSTLIHLCKHIWIRDETARSILEAMRSH